MGGGISSHVLIKAKKLNSQERKVLKGTYISFLAFVPLVSTQVLPTFFQCLFAHDLESRTSYLLNCLDLPLAFSSLDDQHFFPIDSSPLVHIPTAP